MNDLKEVAREQQDFVVGVRQELHQIPEVRWEEAKTLKAIEMYIDWITKLDDRALVATHEMRGGLAVDVDFAGCTDRILFRADVDGLPIVEATGLPFASTNGRMHACGHDTHPAMLLGAFRAIMMGKVKPTKNLRLVFQRAEENPVTPSGGDVLVNEEDVTDDVAAVYGLHIWASGVPGVFYSRPGAILGNSGRLGIEITCSGGHVAFPNLGVNAIRVSHAVAQAMDQFNAISLPPTEPHTLEPACSIAGSPEATNTMPGKAVLWYGARSMLPRERHKAWLEDIIFVVRMAVNQFSGAKVEFTPILGHPATLNTPAEVARLSSLLKGAGEIYEECPPELGGEDFAHYLMRRPGVFTFLGGHREGAGDHHASTFNPDEDVFWRGVHYWLLLATN